MSHLSSALRSLLASAAVVAFAATVAAQQTPARDYSFTDATSEVLPKYKAAIEAKTYDAALAILDAQIAKVPADSYDTAMLLQLKTQTLLTKGDFAKALEPTEKALALSNSKSPTYFDERITRDLTFFLIQLYVQEAVNTKVPGAAAKLFEKADITFKQWLKLVPNSNPDAQLLYAQLLYSWAVQNPENPDKKLIARALEETEKGMHLAIRPKDTFYVLKLAALQQLGHTKETADMFELLIKQKPESSTYYQQLAATYLGLAQSATNPSDAEMYNIRAALTIERAQAQGHMNTPQHNYNLIGIYFNMGQYEKAADLLEAGLKAGTVDKELKNYELWALALQQLQQPTKSIEALKAATQAFPQSGQVEFLIAQAYQGLDKTEEALVHLQKAVAKGNLAKPHSVYLFLAYVAYELKKFDIALDAAKKAAATPEGAKDGANMVKAIEDMQKDREVKKSKM
jgi:tetratricopeptide (TPR) repeat protein